MRRLTGTVVSDKMQKTAVVAVSYEKRHPKYLKYYTVTKRFKAQNEGNEYKTGDEVVIQETRPLSKDKRFKIVELIKRTKNSEQSTENEVLSPKS